MRKVNSDRDRLSALNRTLVAFSHEHTLKRGFALVRDDSGTLVRMGAEVATGQGLEIEFSDKKRVNVIAGETGGTTTPTPKPARAKPPRKSKPTEDGGQGSLF